MLTFLFAQILTVLSVLTVHFAKSLLKYRRFLIIKQGLDPVQCVLWRNALNSKAVLSRPMCRPFAKNESYKAMIISILSTF